MAKPESFLVACDIGSSKVCILIGEPNARGGLDILGKGSTAHRGARKGNIINVDSTVEAIKRSAEEAEIMAGAQITRAYAGLSGSSVRSFNSRGVVAVSGKAREISREDIFRVVDAAKSVQVPQDHEIVHAIPREFSVDGQDGIADPLGMVGARLEANVHIVTAPVAVSQNLAACLNKSGIEVVELVLEQFAAAVGGKRWLCYVLTYFHVITLQVDRLRCSQFARDCYRRRFLTSSTAATKETHKNEQRQRYPTKEPQSKSRGRTRSLSPSLSPHHGQDQRAILLILILPENRHDAERFLLLNQAGQVVAEELAQHFVDHRRIGLAHHANRRTSA